MIVSFGKYRGQSIMDTPIHHVLWLIGQAWFAVRYPDLYPIARDRALKHLQAEVGAEERGEDLV